MAGRYGNVVRNKDEMLAGLAAIQDVMMDPVARVRPSPRMHAGPESHRDNPELKSKGSGSTSTDRRVPPGRGRQVAPTPMSKRDGKRTVVPQTVTYEGMEAPGVRFMANDQMPYIVEDRDTLTSIVQNAPYRPNRKNLVESIISWGSPEWADFIPFNERLRNLEGAPMDLGRAIWEIKQLNNMENSNITPSQRLNLPQGMGHNIWGKPAYRG